jgi:mRNA-degrading endonuclease YafQ of YafQ-DinJ toxin-antitoxin module
LNVQAERLESLTQIQKEMSETISNLADDMSKMKKVMQVVVDRGETATDKSRKHEEQREVQVDLVREQTGRIDVLIEYQREIQMRVQMLQLQVSELSQGLQPIHRTRRRGR